MSSPPRRTRIAENLKRLGFKPTGKVERLRVWKIECVGESGNTFPIYSTSTLEPLARGLKVEPIPAQLMATPIPQMHDNEIPYKEWLFDRAKELGISKGHLANEISSGRYPRPQIRTINKRVMFVSGN